MKVILINFIPIIFAVGLFLAIPDFSHSQTISVEAETGGIWFSRNDVRIPNEGGTDFDMIDLIGPDASAFYRLRLNVAFGERHTFRVLFAPLEKSGAGTFDEPVFFEGTEFSAGSPTNGIYKFSTYRLTYRYTFYNRNDWVLGAGAAGLIRDAKVELVQAGASDSNTDLGFVPLLHFYAQRDIGDRISLIFDAESLAAPQGRATDAALTFHYQLSDYWGVMAGYRLLEGGADVDEVYNFSWINFAFGGVKYNLR